VNIGHCGGRRTVRKIYDAGCSGPLRMDPQMWGLLDYMLLSGGVHN